MVISCSVLCSLHGQTFNEKQISRDAERAFYKGNFSEAVPMYELLLINTQPRTRSYDNYLYQYALCYRSMGWYNRAMVLIDKIGKDFKYPTSEITLANFYEITINYPSFWIYSISKKSDYILHVLTADKGMRLKITEQIKPAELAYYKLDTWVTGIYDKQKSDSKCRVSRLKAFSTDLVRDAKHLVFAEAEDINDVDNSKQHGYFYTLTRIEEETKIIVVSIYGNNSTGCDRTCVLWIEFEGPELFFDKYLPTLWAVIDPTVYGMK